MLFKFYQACTDLRIVSGRDLVEFSLEDQKMIKRCLEMSSMAYEDLKGGKNHRIMEIDEKKFENNFRAHPSEEEIQSGFRTGPCFPQVEIDWNKIIKRVSEKEQLDSTWLGTISN